MRMTEQKRHNQANRWMKNTHECLKCPNPARNAQLVFAHIYQEEKGERLAELANGPIHRMVKEWRRVLPLCASCHNKMIKQFDQSTKRWLERTLKLFNEPHRGKDYCMGYPQYIVDKIVEIHSQPLFSKLSEDQYDSEMRTLTEWAKREKLPTPTPPTSSV
jgi:hypothetical protein